MVESHVNENTMLTLHINIHTKTYIGQVHVHWQEMRVYNSHIGVNMALAKDDVMSRRVVASGEQNSRLVG